MKKIYCTILIMATVFSLRAQTNFHIKGNVMMDTPIAKAVIQYESSPAGTFVIDTVDVIHGRFDFRGTASRPTSTRIELLRPEDLTKIPDPDEDYMNDTNAIDIMFYAQGEMQINWKANDPQIIGGGKEEQVFKKYIKKMQTFSKNNSNASIDTLRGRIASFIKSYPDSYVSFDLTKIWFASVIVPEVFEPVYQAISPRLKALPEAREWEKKLEIAKTLSAGKKAPTFTQNNTNGAPVQLADYRGKYLLLDFWASWCGPCRATNPSLIKVYNKYKKDAFSILSVSLDDDKSAWLKAIKEDHLMWDQVSDLKGSENAAAQIYHIDAIPQNFLIDPTGVIIGKNLSSESLEKKLSEIFN